MSVSIIVTQLSEENNNVEVDEEERKDGRQLIIAFLQYKNYQIIHDKKLKSRCLHLTMSFIRIYFIDVNLIQFFFDT